METKEKEEEEDSHIKSNTLRPYIYREKYFTIWHKMMKPLLHVNSSR